MISVRFPHPLVRPTGLPVGPVPDRQGLGRSSAGSAGRGRTGKATSRPPRAGRPGKSPRQRDANSPKPGAMLKAQARRPPGCGTHKPEARRMSQNGDPDYPEKDHIPQGGRDNPRGKRTQIPETTEWHALIRRTSQAPADHDRGGDCALRVGHSGRTVVSMNSTTASYRQRRVRARAVHQPDRLPDGPRTGRRGVHGQLPANRRGRHRHRADLHRRSAHQQPRHRGRNYCQGHRHRKRRELHRDGGRLRRHSGRGSTAAAGRVRPDYRQPERLRHRADR